jgi:hypothetical protein
MMRHRSARRHAAVWAALVAVLAFASALAASPQIKLALGTGLKDRPIVIAEVLDAEGKPITQREIDFYLMADFFPNAGNRLTGVHPVFLGTGTTDVVGRAQTFYSPPYTGRAVFEARLRGEHEAATGRIEAGIVREENPVPGSIGHPLDAVRQPLGFTILALAVGLWLFLSVLTFTTVQRIRRLGKEVENGQPISPGA